MAGYCQQIRQGSPLFVSAPFGYAGREVGFYHPRRKIE